MGIAGGAKRTARGAALRGLVAVAVRGGRRAGGIPRRVLVIRPDHLGDLLLCTPALHRLRLALPYAEITALVLPSSLPALVNNPDIDHSLPCDFPGFSRAAKRNALAPYAYAIEQARLLRDHAFDVAINLRYDFWWGGLLAELADIPQRIGYAWPESPPFLTDAAHTPPEGSPAWHAAALNLRLVDYALALWGVVAPDAAGGLRFAPTADDRAQADAQLAAWAVSATDGLVAIHPGTGATLKLWTAAGFAAVADGLAARHGARVVLVGGPDDAVLVAEIARRMRTPPLLWPADGGFGRLAALFGRCRLVVGLDSGPMHLAVAVGVPTIHLFGPTDPALFGPYGDAARHRVVQTAVDLPCQPCGVLDFRRGCWRGGYCMRSLTPTRVLAAADDMLTAPNALRVV